MYRTFIAGITALSVTLTATTPVQAQGISDEDLGKLLFGLVATAAVVAMIDNHSSGARRESTAAPSPRIVETPRPRLDRPKGWVGEARRNLLPRQCLRTVHTRRRDVRIFARGCMSQNYPRIASLPRECIVRARNHNTYGQQRRQQGWDAQCMRDYGYQIARRR
jgi:hypothetical protein